MSAGLPLSRTSKSSCSRSGTSRARGIDHRGVDRDGADRRLEGRLVLPRASPRPARQPAGRRAEPCGSLGLLRLAMPIPGCKPGKLPSRRGLPAGRPTLRAASRRPGSPGNRPVTCPEDDRRPPPLLGSGVGMPEPGLCGSCVECRVVQTRPVDLLPVRTLAHRPALPALSGDPGDDVRRLRAGCRRRGARRHHGRRRSGPVTRAAEERYVPGGIRRNDGDDAPGHPQP